MCIIINYCKNYCNLLYMYNCLNTCVQVQAVPPVAGTSQYVVPMVLCTCVHVLLGVCGTHTHSRVAHPGRVNHLIKTNVFKV
jgi:hypothetical protein